MVFIFTWVRWRTDNDNEKDIKDEEKKIYRAT
jgi:hypothetical protein